MAPAKKKNTKLPQKNTGGKRVIKQKKVLKKPQVIKIKIPSFRHKAEPHSSTSKILKNLNQQRKVELANEVALAQLCKDAEIVESVPTTSSVNKSTKKKKNNSETPNSKNVNSKKTKKTVSEFFANLNMTEAKPTSTPGITKKTPNKANKKKTVPKTPKGKSPRPQIKSADTTPQKKRGRSAKNNTPIVTRTLRSNRVLSNEPTTTDAAVMPQPTDSDMSNMSWARDISNSSTTTCVTVSSETMLLDIRQPVVQLQNIDHHLNWDSLNDQRPNRESLTDSSTDSESCCDSDTSNSDEDDQVNSDGPHADGDLSDTVPDSVSGLIPDSLNLSLSSTDRSDDEMFKQINSLLNDIRVNEEKIELEINKLGPEYPCEDIQTEFSNILSFLPLESQMIKHCRYLKSIVDEALSSDPFVNHQCDSKVASLKEENSLKSSSELSLTTDNINESNKNYTPFEEYNACEDEDALSLFAESITDMESSRMNASFSESSRVNASVSKSSRINAFLESSRVNASVSKSSRINAFLESSRVNVSVSESSRVNASVSESSRVNDSVSESSRVNDSVSESSRVNDSVSESSRNNDSASEDEEYVPVPLVAPKETFTYRPTKISYDNHSDGHNNTRAEPDIKLHSSGVVRVATDVTVSSGASWIAGINDRPRFLATMYKPAQGVKSSVFKGVCFFNLISGCKKTRCRYRHEAPEPKEIKRRLPFISEENFIQEYMLMRTWPELRRKYGLCFVNECVNRELTSVLLEMGIDFVTKANTREDAQLKVTVLELVLMHLNRVPLDLCADLLRYTVHYAPFYHTLMNVIADTQNFSRFKAVFIKLSQFIIEEGGSFDIDTVAKILERVCILPFEENLVRAMESVLKNTNKKIYENNMMKQFRVLLGQLEVRGSGDVTQENGSPTQHRPATEQYTSADTPDNDHSKETIAAPTIIRTVDLKRVKPNIMVRPFNKRSNNTTRFRRWGPPSPNPPALIPPPPPHPSALFPPAQPHPPVLFPPHTPNTRRQVSYRPLPLYKRTPGPKF